MDTREFATSGLNLGLLGSALGAAVGALTSKTRGVRGIAVLYKNDKQRLGVFQLVGTADIVTAILNSLPERLKVSYEELIAEYRKNLSR